MNRLFRRMQRFSKSFSARRTQGQMTSKPAEPPVSQRAKSSRHGGSTADKWNQ